MVLLFMLFLNSCVVERTELWLMVSAVRKLRWFKVFRRVVCWVSCCLCCILVILLIILDNTHVDYADDPTLLNEILETCSRVQIVLSLNRDLARTAD